MRQLTIDYILEGRRRGYNFTTPTDGIDAETVKAIWRGAMPRGQGWGAYRDARSLKCFALPSGEVAICETTITDMRDELGRSGIRRTVIDIVTARTYVENLKHRLNTLPQELIAQAEAKLSSREAQLLFKKNREAKRPKSMIKPQTILAYPYSAEGWQFVEACILLLATRSTLLTNLIEMSPKVNPFADRVLSFTTLALDYQDEGRIVAMPLERVRELDGVPFIDIS
ncbi:MAG TPA: hypothetical protein VK003_08780 [Oceanobacillus sp.]|nr:hypothetical protein [Oceanobacillus sp.]